jgi:hypothetical protein
MAEDFQIQKIIHESIAMKVSLSLPIIILAIIIAFVAGCFF